jgi:hypothetical protein
MMPEKNILQRIGGPALLQQGPYFLLLFLIVTIPFLFGAVHPIVQAAYVALILVGLGGWLLYALPTLQPEALSRPWLGIPAVLIVYMAVQSLPLPLALVEMLSPARAERVAMVNALADTGQTMATLGENGIIGLQTAIFALALIIFYVAFSFLLRRNEKFLVYIFYGIACVGLLEGVYGLLQVMNPGIGMLWLSIKNPEAHGTIIYKNQYAALLNICWPLAVAGALIFSGQTAGRAAGPPKGIADLPGRMIRFLSNMQPQTPFFLFAAGVMILAVLFSLSRGGILAMLTVGVLLNLFLPLSGRTKLFTTLIILVFIGIYGSLLGPEGILARFDTIESSGTNRLRIYQASLPMLFDHWLTGIGFDSFKLLSGVYLKEFPENILYDRVHNDYLELVIELGLPMAALFLLWLVAGVWHIGRQLTGRGPVRDETRRARIIGTAAFCALLGFLVHGFVDFGWRLPANTVYAVTLLALISWSLAEVKEKGQSGPAGNTQVAE